MSAEALTSTIGDELNLISGTWFTRTTTNLFLPDTVQTSNEGLEFNDASPGTLTLSLGTFSATIIAGDVIEAISNVPEVIAFTVVSRDSDTQLTVTPIPDVESFSNAAFRITNANIDSIPVESTHRFPDSGSIAIDGIVYTYTSKTRTTFDGITYVGLNSTIVSGIKQNHQALTTVADNSQTIGEIYEKKNSLFVDTATGEDLTTLGTNLGVPRVSGFSDDELYRQVIQLVAYSRRGTRFLIQDFLTLVFGAGNFVYFESHVRNEDNDTEAYGAGTIYISANDPTKFVAKFFIEGRRVSDLIPLVDSFSVDIPDAFTHNDYSLNTVPHGENNILIEPNPTLLVSSTDGTNISGTAGSFPSSILPGDEIEICGAGLQNRRSTITSRISDTAITVGNISDLPNQSATLSTFSNRCFRIHRVRPYYGLYRPSEEVERIGSTLVPRWTYTGAVAESTGAILLTSPPRLILDGGGAARPSYRTDFRGHPEDLVTISVVFQANPLLNTGADIRTQSLVFSDGIRYITLGLGPASLASMLVGLADGAGGFFFPGTLLTETFRHELQIVKDGTRSVSLLRDGNTIQSIPYSSFPLTTAVTDPTANASGKFISFGVIPSTAANTSLSVEYVQINTQPRRELRNSFDNVATTAAPNRITGGTFSLSDAGKLLRVRDTDAVNPEGGSSVGVWEITNVISTSEVLVTGRTRRRGQVLTADPNVFLVADDLQAFVLPHDQGHQLEILTGVNAGLYAIDAFTDKDGVDIVIEPGFLTALSFGSYLTFDSNDYPTECTSPVLFASGVRLTVPLIVNLEEVDWRLVPTFPTSNCKIELFETVSRTGQTIAARDSLGAIGEPIQINRTTFPNSVLYNDNDVNVLIDAVTQQFTLSPLYLMDNFGFLKSIIQDLVTAGVRVRFDEVEVDDSGFHLSS